MSQFGGHYSGRGGFGAGLLILLLLWGVGSIVRAWVEPAETSKYLRGIDQSKSPFRELIAPELRAIRLQREREDVGLAERARRQQEAADRERRLQERELAQFDREMRASLADVDHALRPVLGGPTRVPVRSGGMRSSDR